MKKILLSLALLTQCLFTFAQPEIISHRGFWNAENTAQNSIGALFNAQSIQIYGSELDVYISKDKIPVVFHDNKINEKLVEETSYQELSEHILKNGEPIPTLEAYFQQGLSDKNTKLIIEIKSHSTPELETEAVLIISQLIEKYDVLPQVDFIAFSLHVCKELVKIYPNSEIAYLNGDLPPLQLKELGISGIDYNISRFREHPEWIKEARDLGMKINVWTVNKEEDIRTMIDLGVDFITTDYPLLAKKILGSR